MSHGSVLCPVDCASRGTAGRPSAVGEEMTVVMIFQNMVLNVGLCL